LTFTASAKGLSSKRTELNGGMAAGVAGAGIAAAGTASAKPQIRAAAARAPVQFELLCKGWK
jgi:hypothetical protein